MGVVDTCVSFWREFWVAGARFYPKGIAALGADPVDKPLKLVPEPENPHDANAVAVVVPTARGGSRRKCWCKRTLSVSETAIA